MSDVEAIEKLLTEWEAAVNAADVSGLARLLADDALMMPPGEQTVIGKGEILSWVGPLFDRFSIEETDSVDEVEVSGDWAFLLSSFVFRGTPKAEGESLQTTGKTVFILRRQPDGSWKVARAIWNRDHSLPGH